jgi:hypothetical protein
MKNIETIFLVMIFLFCSIPLGSMAEENGDETFTISGTIYDSTGSFIANRTSIKVDSLNSVWSNDDGYYQYAGISPGTHTIRAYFMNDGHSVSYRTIEVSSDTQLDWYVGNNWFTMKMYDQSEELITDSESNTIELLEPGDITPINSGFGEFGPLEIGQYYTFKGNFGSIDDSSQYLYAPLLPGSSSNPSVNDYSFYHGQENRFGFVTDINGIGMSNVLVSSGSKSSITNNDGYYLLSNFHIGEEIEFNFTRSGIQIIDPISATIADNQSWMNVTSDISVELPEMPYFTTQVQTITDTNLVLMWEGGNFTEFYSVYQNEIQLYRGTQTEYNFQPSKSGSYEFNIEASNQNGTTFNNFSLLIIVLPKSAQSDAWTSGMKWNYETVYTPSSIHGSHNVSMTVVGTETVTDSFGNERESFLTRIDDNTSTEGTETYRWIDALNFFTLHTYWVDAPSESSYYMEGTLGWNFTNSSGQEVNPISSTEDLNLHFNRTNVIGVPGHPDGNDDTENLVEINHNVVLVTKAGTFVTTHIIISDINDGIVSWELWYNETVKNWVKIIDRLPGSHDEMVVKELISYEFPIVPQFITESKYIQENDYSLQWADFDGAVSYQLLENNNLIYSGTETSYDIYQQSDGIFSYQINAEMISDESVEGNLIQLEVFYILPPPAFDTDSQSIKSTDEILISWTSEEENISWYSLTLIDSEGEMTELYNGTENIFTVGDLEPGQNRFRVKQGLGNGKFSLPSDSIFMSVENSQDTDKAADRAPDLPVLFSLLAILFSVFVYSRR